MITAPSLIENENVSGISTLVRNIIADRRFDYVHFPAGRKDNERVRIVWIFKQILLPMRFAWTIFRQKTDVVHINTALSPFSIIRDFVLTLTARFFGFPVLLHVHGGPFIRENIPGLLLSWMTGEMLNSADCVAVLSEEEKQHFHERWRISQVHVLPNSVLVESPAREPARQGPARIAFLGRIEKNKGLKEIEQACRILYDRGLDFTFVCCGNGPDTEEFVVSMGELLGDRFEFRGVVSGDDKRKAFAESDIFVLPSYFEGLPLALLEAMAAGCIVVASDVGSIATVVEDGINGFLIEPKDGEQFAEKLDLLISNIENLFEIRENARRTIGSKYSMDIFFDELGKTYLTIAPEEFRGARGLAVIIEK